MTRIPSHGRPWPALAAELEAAKEGDYAWRRGRVPLYVYWLNEELARVQQEAYRIYWSENALGMRAFPSLKRLEDEVIAMSLDLLGAPAGAGATFTSGGSESIFLALRAARVRAAREQGISEPNIVIPQSAHLTFNRAADFQQIAVRRIPTGANRLADVAGMAAAIDANTIALVASAPNYPFGLVDPIAEIAALASARGLWMHVDACVGGFLAPWAKRLGEPVPDWDFSVPGVCSISADLHKYGMAAKGASLLLMRDDSWRALHRFESRAWERGPYAGYATTGTRPGGAIAAAWATMNFLGEDGYLDCARRILRARDVMVEGIAGIPGLEVLRPAGMCIFVWRATDKAIEHNALAAALDRRGWLVSRQQEPDGFHLALNPVHDEVAEDYVADVGAAVREVRGTANEDLRGQAVGQTY
ncbi:MAG: aspartate aminotransferase family protein [Acetobacteraceae bacterium]|nr:aspartate aminotransferase family protein [Acetobacteraceae bacterium]